MGQERWDSGSSGIRKSVGDGVAWSASALASTPPESRRMKHPGEGGGGAPFLGALAPAGPVGRRRGGERIPTCQHTGHERTVTPAARPPRSLGDQYHPGSCCSPAKLLPICGVSVV